MNSTTPAKPVHRRSILGAMAFGTTVWSEAARSQAGGSGDTTAASSLTRKQLAIAPIGAGVALGDLPALATALHEGLDAGLAISDVKEILVQMYAYTGFPRSLNALGELMKVLDARKQRGVHDAPGRAPGPVPAGKDLLALGTANQTKLSGAPVKGPLFDFAPAIDEFLKTHLFGDIFGRDNLDWRSRELATVGALAALAGAESQLQSHIRISMNVGLSATQLREAAQELARRGLAEPAQRAQRALERVSDVQSRAPTSASKGLP